jgi:hypothetical protein
MAQAKQIKTASLRQKSGKSDLPSFEKKIKDLSAHETKELLLLQAYKLALLRGQVEALADILVKNKIATREEIWKLTEENFEDTSL